MGTGEGVTGTATIKEPVIHAIWFILDAVCGVFAPNFDDWQRYSHDWANVYIMLSTQAIEIATANTVNSLYTDISVNNNNNYYYNDDDDDDDDDERFL